MTRERDSIKRRRQYQLRKEKKTLTDRRSGIKKVKRQKRKEKDRYKEGKK